MLLYLTKFLQCLISTIEHENWVRAAEFVHHKKGKPKYRRIAGYVIVTPIEKMCNCPKGTIVTVKNCCSNDMVIPTQIHQSRSMDLYDWMIMAAK